MKITTKNYKNILNNKNKPSKNSTLKKVKSRSMFFNSKLHCKEKNKSKKLMPLKNPNKLKKNQKINFLRKFKLPKQY